jgi:RNA polymerase sigma-70 factor (ECF subfamily)
MAFEGYQYDEIASEMNVPTGTIKSRIFNARKRLMEDLKDFN